MTNESDCTRRCDRDCTPSCRGELGGEGDYDNGRKSHEYNLGEGSLVRLQVGRLRGPFRVISVSEEKDIVTLEPTIDFEFDMFLTLPIDQVQLVEPKGEEREKEPTSWVNSLKIALFAFSFFGALVGLIFLSIVWSMPSPIDWRDPMEIQLQNDVFYEVENGEIGPLFNGTHHDLVPDDTLYFGEVIITHFSTASSTSCESGYTDEYGNYYEGDCWTTYWDVFVLDVGGMNFSVEGNSHFMHSCYNALCNITATVDGNQYGRYWNGEMLTITVQEFEWVRWCQGEGVCE